MTVLEVGSMVLELPRRGPPNPLPPLRLLGELHGEIDPAGLDAELARNLGYGQVSSVLPYLLEDDYSRELAPRPTRVAVLENERLRAVVLLELGGRLWSLRDKLDGRELLYTGDRVQLGNLGLANAWFAGGVEWNLGTTGHTALTCSPVHAAALELPDGTPGLRIYEWERLRDLVYQVDLRLPPGSRQLVVDVRVTNPNDRVVPVYWWSNAAVPCAAGTRVVVPGRSAFEFTYARRLRRVPVPGGAGDLTYPGAAARTADHFFELDPVRRPWIAAVDEAGAGLLQVSTGRLRGRKLFSWGTGRGGRRWQEFLTGSPEAYFEVQAGLARTQLEHLPLGPGASWAWTEVYGPVSVPAGAAHGAWAGAVAAVESAIAAAGIDALLDRHASVGPGSQGGRLHAGSGWGALESLRREVTGERPSAVVDRLFPRSGLGEDQEPWVALLETGTLPSGTPRSYVAGPGWEGLVERAAGGAAALLHRGVVRWQAGRREAAVAAWEAAHSQDPASWPALRNLAAADGLLGEPRRSAERYRRAVGLAPDIAQLRVEAVGALIAAGRLPEAAELARTAPPSAFTGRLRFLEAWAAALGGDVRAAEAVLAGGLDVADLREGEASLSELWLLCRRGCAAAPGCCRLAGAGGAHPDVPARYDFRLGG